MTDVQPLKSLPLNRPAPAKRFDQRARRARKLFHQAPTDASSVCQVPSPTVTWSSKNRLGPIRSPFEFRGTAHHPNLIEVGSVDLTDRITKTKIPAIIFSVRSGSKDEGRDEEYAIKIGDEVVGVISMSAYYEEGSKYVGMKKEDIPHNSTYRFSEEKPFPNLIDIHVLARTDKGKYEGVIEALYGTILARQKELEKEDEVQFSGYRLTTSWNSTDLFLGLGFKPMDLKGCKTAAEIEAYVKDQLKKSDDEQNFSCLGCNIMYLSDHRVEELRERIIESEENQKLNLNGTEPKQGASLKITKANGNTIQASINITNEGNNLKNIQIIHEGNVLASATVNRMLVGIRGTLEDYMGEYPANSEHYEGPSPFAVYGSGDNKKLSIPRLFMETDSSPFYDECPNLRTQLFDIVFEMALKDPIIKGKVQMEADWEEAGFYFKSANEGGLGMSFQDPPSGLSTKDQIQNALNGIKEETPSGCKPNNKQVGSFHMFADVATIEKNLSRTKVPDVALTDL